MQHWRMQRNAIEINNNLVGYNTFSFKNEEKPSGGINNRPIPMESPEMIMYRLLASNQSFLLVVCHLNYSIFLIRMPIYVISLILRCLIDLESL